MKKIQTFSEVFFYFKAVPQHFIFEGYVLTFIYVLVKQGAGSLGLLTTYTCFRFHLFHFPEKIELFLFHQY